MNESDKPIPDSDEARDEARAERAEQPPEPAKPYDESTLAQFRARRNNVFYDIAGPIARFLATVDAKEAERDAARAQVGLMGQEIVSLRRELAQAQEALEVAKAGVLHTELESDELREAARALVGELSQSTSRCEHHMGCAALATKFLAWEGDSETMCDEHAQATAAADAPDRVEDLSYAPALRRLRALIKAKP